MVSVLLAFFTVLWMGPNNISLRRLRPLNTTWEDVWWPKVKDKLFVDHQKLKNRMEAEAPLALDLLYCCMEAGLPLRKAVAVVEDACEGAISAWLKQINASIQVGKDEQGAWSDLRTDPVLGRLAQDVARSVGSGAALAKILRRHSSALREQRRSAALEQAKTVGVKSVLPLMCCFLPAFVVLGVIPIIASVGSTLLGG